jgi:hypothetical protein
MEQKLDFTIQNEYHKSREPIVIKEGFNTNDLRYSFESNKLLRNHTYKLSTDQSQVTAVSITYFKRDGTITAGQYLEAPAQVEILNLFERDGNAILQWVNLDNEFRYIIEYKFVNDNWNTNAVTRVVVGENITSESFSGLVKGVQYDFRIQAENNIGPGPFSEVRNITLQVPSPIGPGDSGGETTDPETAVTSAPSFITTSTTTSSITYGVRNNDGDTATVTVTLNGANPENYSLDSLGTALNRTYTGLAPGNYTLSAVAQALGKQQSSVINYFFTINETESVPFAPSNLNLNVISHSIIEASWIDNATNEQGFRLRIIGNNGYDSGPFTINSPQTVNVVYRFENLTAEVTYTLYVSAYNTAGDSAVIQASATTPPAPVVATTAQPTILDLVPGQTSVSFRVRNNDSASVDWYYEINDSTPDLLGGTLSGTSTSTTITIPNSQSATNLTNNTTYTLYATAIANNKLISSSAAFQFTTLAATTIPTAPSWVNFTGALGQLGLQWNDNSNNESEFDWAVSTTSNFSSIVRDDSTAANATSVNVFDLPDGTYYARIRSRNSAGASGWVNAPNSATLSTSSGGGGGCPGPNQLIGTFCNGTTLIGEYTDGTCGTYTAVIESNSTSCGYTPPPSDPIPATPSSASASSPSNSTLSGSWSSSSGASYYEYVIYRNGSYWTGGTTAGTSFTQGSLNEGNYYFTVRACSSGGCSGTRTSNTVFVSSGFGFE